MSQRMDTTVSRIPPSIHSLSITDEEKAHGKVFLLAYSNTLDGIKYTNTPHARNAISWPIPSN